MRGRKGKAYAEFTEDAEGAEKKFKGKRV